MEEKRNYVLELLSSSWIPEIVPWRDAEKRASPIDKPRNSKTKKRKTGNQKHFVNY